MQLIRIEDPTTGDGVWRSCDDNYSCKLRQHSQFSEIGKRHNGPSFPPPSEDTQLYRQLRGPLSHYKFAFLSLEQLEQGFTRKELEELITDIGFRVYCIEATDVLHSTFQAIFKPESIISQEDISFMFLTQ